MNYRVLPCLSSTTSLCVKGRSLKTSVGAIGRATRDEPTHSLHSTHNIRSIHTFNTHSHLHTSTQHNKLLRPSHIHHQRKNVNILSTLHCKGFLCNSTQQRRVLHTSPAHHTHVIKEVKSNDGSVLIQWEDGTEEWQYPYPWLRENCPCPKCYDTPSFTRLLTLDEWDHEDAPLKVTVCGGGSGVDVEWASGHVSNYGAIWLRERGFTQRSREVKRSLAAVKKELWSKKLELSRFDYTDITTKDKALLDFLMALERVGVVLVTDTPRKPKAAFEIVNKIGFPKQTHYGLHYPIRNKLEANSLAYTDNKLGMHNDLPYFQYVPGIIFLHCIIQFEGAGGENDLTDGYYVAQHLRRHHPQEYRILSTTPVYFWNKGSAMVEQETTDFYKLLSTPIIVENPITGKVVRVNFSQLRDSYLDIPPEEVTPWYAALRLLHHSLQEHAIRNKLNSGETLVMDNTRLLHGRTAYDGAKGERYMDQVYLDWDMALSKRRVLQEKLGLYIEH